MNIGLLAVDSNYPNLALMKISSYHKAGVTRLGGIILSIIMIKCIWLKYSALQRIIGNG